MAQQARTPKWILSTHFRCFTSICNSSSIWCLRLQRHLHSCTHIQKYTSRYMHIIKNKINVKKLKQEEVWKALTPHFRGKVFACACNSSAGGCGDRWIPEACWLVSLAQTLNSRSSEGSVGNKVWWRDTAPSLSSIHACTGAHIHLQNLKSNFYLIKIKKIIFFL